MGGGQSKLLATLDGFNYLETLKVSKSSTENKKGFTLAEVLITLGIIGVVAAITMPMLITNVRNHVRAKRIENIEQKFSKATDKMVALGVYTGHSSTQEFVNELGKHLKLAKVCSNDNLQSCWPYEKVVLNDNGKIWNINKTISGDTLLMNDDNNQEWDKTVGLITVDGTSMILSYNKKCDIDETKRITWNDAKSSTTGCIAAVYDWNGERKPNKFNDDVLTFNANGLGFNCVVELDGVCFGTPFTPDALTYAECEELRKDSSFGIKGCIENDGWAGAVKKCGGVQNMPSREELGKLASEMYLDKWGNKVIIDAESNYTNLVFQENSTVAKALKLNTNPQFWIFTNEEIKTGPYSWQKVYNRHFMKNDLRLGGDGKGFLKAICIDKNN